jgi:uncharacterized membrane protein YhfC
MALKALLLCVQGFLFIFLPGVVMSFIMRRGPAVDRGLVWWGAGGLLVALLPMNFFGSLARQILAASGGSLAAQLAVAALLSGLFVESMKYLVLRYRRLAGGAAVPAGIAVGLGVGLITRIFVGFALVGTGIRLLWGDTSTPLLAETAARSFPDLGLAALTSLADRLALLLLNAGLGAVVGRAIADKKRRLLFVAVFIHAAIELAYGVVTVSLEGTGQLATLAAFAFDCTLVVGAWSWLNRQLPLETAAVKKQRNG